MEPTGLILTYNEELNLDRTLSSVRHLRRVVVLDSFSTDRTSEIAHSYANVMLVQRDFDSHAQQWNAGLEVVETDWVLTLDADYVVSPAFGDEVAALPDAPPVVGYFARFLYMVEGKPLRTSIYPPRVVLFQKSKGRYFDEGHTQQLRIEGTVGQLANPLLHDDRKPLSRWLVSQDRYAQLEAEHLGKAETLKGVDRVRKAIMVAPLVMPVYLLIGRGLILDGWRGWYYTAQRTIAELLLSLRLLEKKLQR